ncbi:MAG TPA: hypothetical protein VED37_08075 [Ktedonobacteraceae bacterium]|nr:hypothetical protein [Ktedonobacteraceae bacterium]
MKKIHRTTSGRGALVALFPLFARFTNHRMTCPGLGMKAFGPSRRFSTQLWRSSRCAQLVQKSGHRPSHLPQRRNRGAGLPRSVAPLQQRTSQHQQIVRAGDDVCPALRPLRGTQPWLIPEQFLFVKAIAVLMRVAQAIGRADLGQRSRALPFPDKPTDLGVASLATGPITDDLDHRDLDLTSRTQVQVLPTAHLDARSFGVQTFPGLIRFAMAALVLALKALPIFATGSQLTGETRRGGTVEDAIPFDPQEAARLDVGQASQERRAGVPAVADNDGMQPPRQQQGHHGAQLAGGYRSRQFRRSDARRVQNEGALPGVCGQEHHVTHHPAWAGRVRVLGQIGDGHQRAILGSFSLWTVQVAGIHSQQNDFPGCWQGREVHKELTQALGIDLAVFQRFVQAGPGPLKKRRERQFGEAAGSAFTGERIHQIEQGVFGVAKAVVHPVTKFVQCVKVHESNAPEFDSCGYITPPRQSFTRIAEVNLV